MDDQTEPNPAIKREIPRGVKVRRDRDARDVADMLAKKFFGYEPEKKDNESNK